MSVDGEISAWIENLKDGDERAVEVIWRDYFEKLVRLAQRRLNGLPQHEATGESVALSAMNSFVRRAQDGRFPKLDDSDDMWKLLVTITARKALLRMRQYLGPEKGGVNATPQAALSDGSQDGPEAGIAVALGKEPSPQIAVEFSETLDALTQGYEDDSYRELLQLKLEGWTNQEICEKLDIPLRTLERRLARIRKKWTAEYERWTNP